MRNSIKREDISAIINYKNSSNINDDYVNNKLTVNDNYSTDTNSVIICDDRIYMVKASSKQIMRRLNKSYFLKP